MKQATTTAVRDNTRTASNATSRLGNPDIRSRIEHLLRRYPDTSEAETGEVRHFLATGSHLDVGLVAGSDELADKVARFRSDHGGAFRLKMREIIGFVAIVGGPVTMLFWRYLG